jgi:hypothetical protein
VPLSALERKLGELSRGEALSLRALLTTIAVAGALDGAAIGSYACDSLDRARLMLFAGIKLPFLLLASAVLCLPGFFVINAVAGLSHAFTRTLRAIVAGQAALALALVSLSPLVLFAYLSGVAHALALLLNALAFACASTCGQVVMHRYYRALILEDPRHRSMLVVWVLLYALVGIQMGWLLRPFVGDPNARVTFFRPEPVSNAYLVLVQLVLEVTR